MRNRPGFSLVEVMIAVVLLGLTGTIFAALYPQSMRLRAKSEYVTRATLRAQQKIEQLRSLSYDNLSYDGMHDTGIIDAGSPSGPFAFTTVDGLASDLPEGAGTITFTDLDDNLIRVDVTVTWGGIITQGNTVTLSTFVVNRTDMEATSS